MKILAIDPGSTEAGFYRGLSYGPWTGRYKGNRPERLRFFADQLESILQFDQYDVVAYERPFARGRDATRCLWGVAGIIEAMATRHGAAVLDIPNQTLKKWATEAGKLRDKAPMIEAMEKLIGISGLNEHEADAVCIYKYVEATMVVTPGGKK